MQRNREEMFALIEQWKESSEPRKAFCQKHGLAESTFSYWYSKYRKSTNNSGQPGGFVNVQPSLHDNLEVVYPNGVKIRLPQDTSLADLRALIQLV